MPTSLALDTLDPSFVAAEALSSERVDLQRLSPSPSTKIEEEWLALSEEGKRVSETEYWESYYQQTEFRYEWNNGVLEVKPMADYLSFTVYRWFLELLGHFLFCFPIAKIFGQEVGFRLGLAEKTCVRVPDLALVLDSNPNPVVPLDRRYGGTYDLCIEFLSDSTRGEVERDTMVKKAEYAEAGVSEYYLLDRLGQETSFYRLASTGVYEPIPITSEGVLRSAILPGFQFKVLDLYEKPLFHKLSADAVYREFVMPYYQEEKRKTRKERQARQAAERREEKERATRQALEVEVRRLQTLLERQGRER